MKELRTEIVSIRLTKAERQKLDEMGGATEVLRRMLFAASLPPVGSPAYNAGGSLTVRNDDFAFVWSDGTVGPKWPATTTR